jgi:hypothetical protein
MNYIKILIYLLLILLIHIKNVTADEIADRFKYEIGDEISYNIETILPNKAQYVSKSKLLNIIDNEEIWKVFNSPSADKRIYDRTTGNWIASFKDGSEVARAIPHNGGLRFPMKKGDKWTESWTFTAAGGLISGKSEANYKIKKETIKANNKKYKTLKVEMRDPLWNSEKDRNWKKEIRWIEIKSGKIIKIHFKNIGFKMEYIATLIE